MGTCPFCKAERLGKADEERVQDIMKRVDVNDAGVMTVMASKYYQGGGGWLQDQTKAMELYARAAELGSTQAHFFLGNIYHEGGDLKKAKFHIEAAALAGHELARYNLGLMEYDSKNYDRAVKHWTIAASSGCFRAMHNLRNYYERGWVSRESINSSLAAYNNSCVEMRSEARDAYVHFFMVKYL
jgi:TPR repeat protein